MIVGVWELQKHFGAHRRPLGFRERPLGRVQGGVVERGGLSDWYLQNYWGYKAEFYVVYYTIVALLIPTLVSWYHSLMSQETLRCPEVNFSKIVNLTVTPPRTPKTTKFCVLVLKSGLCSIRKYCHSNPSNGFRDMMILNVKTTKIEIFRNSM